MGLWLWLLSGAGVGREGMEVVKRREKWLAGRWGLWVELGGGGWVLVLLWVGRGVGLIKAVYGCALLAKGFLRLRC